MVCITAKDGGVRGGEVLHNQSDPAYVMGGESGLRENELNIALIMGVELIHLYQLSDSEAPRFNRMNHQSGDCGSCPIFPTSNWGQLRRVDREEKEMSREIREGIKNNNSFLIIGELLWHAPPPKQRKCRFD